MSKYVDAAGLSPFSFAPERGNGGVSVWPSNACAIRLRRLGAPYLGESSPQRDPTHEALQRFIRAGAWIDAALQLLSLAAPGWRVRRLEYDGGDWHCALSRHCGLPDWLDDCVEAHNHEPAAALLDAIEALHAAPRECEEPRLREATPGDFLNCDNFS